MPRHIAVINKRVNGNTQCVCLCDQSTVTLARGRPHVPRRDKAEAGGAVCGHGGFIQGDDLVAEVQWAIQTHTQLLNHTHDADPDHVLDHSRRGVKLAEDNLMKIQQEMTPSKGLV